MSHSSVLERSRTSQNTQNLSIYGLGGKFSYTQTVVSKIIEMIESGSSKGPQRNYDINRVMTDTNPGAITSVNGAALSVVPIANDESEMLVPENCLVVDKALKMGDSLHLMGWYSLQVEHALVCLEGDNIENIASIYCHPQGLIQCAPSLQKLGQKENVEISSAENPEELEKAGFNPETDLFLCSVKDWKNFQEAGYYLIESEFHTNNKESKKGNDRCHLVCGGITLTEAKRILGTSQTLQICRRKIWELNRFRLEKAASTTSHLDNGDLRRGQAVITGPKAIEYYQDPMRLKVLDWDFGPKNNFTHFAVFSNSTQKIPGLNLNKGWGISTIELLDAQKEKEIRKILKKSGISILFEKVEREEKIDLFTGMLDLTSVKSSVVNACVRQINSNGIGGRMELMSPE